MKRSSGWWGLLIVWAVVPGFLPTPVARAAQTFSGVALLAPTNAQGQVKGISINTGNSRYVIVTNKMSPSVLQGYAKLHDKPVEVKGEISQIGKDLCLTLSGSIKDMTPALKGGMLTVTKDADTGKVTSMKVKLADRKSEREYTYTITPKGLSEDDIAKIATLNGRPVDLDGVISHSTMSVTLKGPVKPSASSGLLKPPAKKKR